MRTKYLILLLVKILGLGLAIIPIAGASDFLPGLSDNVTCFQNGTAILKTQNRIREFSPSEVMKLVVDINLGQVSESHLRVYASTVGEVACVVTTQK